MPVPNKPRRRAIFWVFLIFIVIVFLLLKFFFSFYLHDEAFSRVISARLDTPVELRGVRWKPLFGVSFQSAELLNLKATKPLRCGPGHMQYRPRFGGADLKLYLSDLQIPADFFRFLPILSAGQDAPQNIPAFHFQKAVFSLNSLGSIKRLRILRMQSPQLELKGSLRWSRGHLEKASLAILMPSAWTERPPSSLCRRLKCAYSHNHLTFYGRSGPLLRAAWTPES